MSTWSATVKETTLRMLLNLEWTSLKSLAWEARVVESRQWVNSNYQILSLSNISAGGLMYLSVRWIVPFLFSQCQRTVKMRAMLYCTLPPSSHQGESAEEAGIQQFYCRLFGNYLQYRTYATLFRGNCTVKYLCTEPYLFVLVHIFDIWCTFAYICSYIWSNKL